MTFKDTLNMFRSYLSGFTDEDAIAIEVNDLARNGFVGGKVEAFESIGPKVYNYKDFWNERGEKIKRQWLGMYTRGFSKARKENDLPTTYESLMKAFQEMETIPFRVEEVHSYVATFTKGSIMSSPQERVNLVCDFIEQMRRQGYGVGETAASMVRVCIEICAIIKVPLDTIVRQITETYEMRQRENDGLLKSQE